MMKFESESGRELGVVYDNSPFWYVVVDLIDSPKPFAYGRVIYCAESNGTVVLPCLDNGDGEPLFGLLDIFRHSKREGCIEFPRGFMASKFISCADNALKELSEEFGADISSVTEITHLGKLYADTGLTPGHTDIFLVKIRGTVPVASVGHEGIKRGFWISENDLSDKIKNGEITDSFTVGAFMYYLLNK
ncbi:MAG: hypothetical protein IKU19_00950 [Clostridia bacterium]|nr:hypothetical protein [Clostridia bacterium]